MMSKLYGKHEKFPAVFNSRYSSWFQILEAYDKIEFYRQSRASEKKLK